MSRYIDADALLEDVRKNSASYFADDFAREWVDRQPTADVRENVRGEWVNCLEYCSHLLEQTGERYFPSGLGSNIYCNKCWKENDKRSNFCPNCGADMRGEKNDKGES